MRNAFFLKPKICWLDPSRRPRVYWQSAIGCLQFNPSKIISLSYIENIVFLWVVTRILIRKGNLSFLLPTFPCKWGYLHLICSCSQLHSERQVGWLPPGRFMDEVGTTDDLSKAVLCAFAKEGKAGIGFFHFQLGSVFSAKHIRAFSCSLKYFWVLYTAPEIFNDKISAVDPKLKTTKDQKVIEGKHGKCKKIWVSEGQEERTGWGTKFCFSTCWFSIFFKLMEKVLWT